MYTSQGTRDAQSPLNLPLQTSATPNRQLLQLQVTLSHTIKSRVAKFIDDETVAEHLGNRPDVAQQERGRLAGHWALEACLTLSWSVGTSSEHPGWSCPSHPSHT